MQDDSDISDGVSRADFTGFSKLRLLAPTCIPLHRKVFFNAMEG